MPLKQSSASGKVMFTCIVLDPVSASAKKCFRYGNELYAQPPSEGSRLLHSAVGGGVVLKGCIILWPVHFFDLPKGRPIVSYTVLWTALMKRGNTILGPVV